MPKQSRGFWLCDFCGLAFDSFEEANSHENLVCQQQRRRGGNYNFHREQDFYSTDPMPPYSSQGDAVLDTPPITYGYDRVSGSQTWSRLLLAPNETSYLSESDTSACRSLEFFELEGDGYSQSTRKPMVPGELGIRCCYCRSSTNYPRSISSIVDNVRQMSDEHLVSCRSAPSEVCRILRQAAQRRSKLRPGSGSAWHEEESNRRSLMEFCISRCHQLGITDRHPENTGIVLGRMGWRLPGVEMGHMAARGTATTAHHLVAHVDEAPSDKVRWETRQSSGSLRIASPYTETHSARLVSEAARPRFEHGYEESRPYEGSFTSTYQSPTQPISAVAGRTTPGDHMEPMPLESHNEVSSRNHTPMHTSGTTAPLHTPVGGESSFPFFQVPNGDWMCKYCSHLPLEYRAHNFIWSTPSKTPPSSAFVDYHLSLCSEYNRINYSYYQGPSAYSPYIESTSPAPYPSPQVAWDARQYAPQPAVARGQDFSPRMGPEAPGPRSEQTSYASSQPREQNQHISSTHLLLSRPEGGEMELATRRAIEHLVATDRSNYDDNGNPLPEEGQLVLNEDRLLLTDYFFYQMKQLRLVRFSEADRRTRGGKRENIQVGYGGLQCVHCAGASNARKFFWSNVDRLANSFAEIPAHILKCRRCSPATKDALLHLKQLHPEQMARLPRGSQKVFFRRMWRRLHDSDPELAPPDKELKKEDESSPSTADTKEPAKLEPLETKPPSKEESPDRTAASEESVFLLERSASEAAKALANTSTQAAPPSPSSRVLLAIPDDKDWLSDTDCFVRRQIEVFCATKDDIQTAKLDHKFSVHEGQIGIRCIHCALTTGARLNAVAFPFTISGMYESVREFQRLHLDDCTNAPPVVKSKLDSLKGASSLSSVLRKYYIHSARALGLYDTKDGIRAGGQPVPFGSQTAFSFSEEKSTISDEMRKMPPNASPIVRSESQGSVRGEKRKATDDPVGSPTSKRPPSKS